MTETLLSPSNVLLFGRQVDDLLVVDPIVMPSGTVQIKLASVGPIDITADIPPTIDGESTKGLRRILLKNQNPPVNDEVQENGVYRIVNKKLKKIDNLDSVTYWRVKNGRVNGKKTFERQPDGNFRQHNGIKDESHNPFSEDRPGQKSQVELQLQTALEPCFARIYGFSFEGSYYDLSRPILFLVHGEGVPASEAGTGAIGAVRAARAPGDPSLTGLGTADFQFADDVMVWSYDKADYTIRMDVETGMFEDVLLAAVLGGGPGSVDARGMQARGMQARGMQARGMQARGMQARGVGNSD